MAADQVILDSFKLLQSNSKANDGKKISWMIFKRKEKGKGMDIQHKGDKNDEEKDTEEDHKARHEEFTTKLLKEGEPRFGVIDFFGKVVFVSYVDDTHKPQQKFPYANGREAFKNSLNGIKIDIQANSAGDLSYKRFKEEVDKTKKS